MVLLLSHTTSLCVAIREVKKSQRPTKNSPCLLQQQSLHPKNQQNHSKDSPSVASTLGRVTFEQQSSNNSRETPFLATMAETTVENIEENSLTMLDVLQEENQLEEDANAVLGASDDKNCTYSKVNLPLIFNLENN